MYITRHLLQRQVARKPLKIQKSTGKYTKYATQQQPAASITLNAPLAIKVAKSNITASCIEEIGPSFPTEASKN